jgi:hypothetical protein
VQLALSCSYVLDLRAADLRSGAIEPKFYKKTGRFVYKARSCDYEKIDCTRAELSDYDAQQQIDQQRSTAAEADCAQRASARVDAR